MDNAIDHLEKLVMPSTRKVPYFAADLFPSSPAVLRQPDDKTSYELTPLICVLLGISPPSKPSKLVDITFFDQSLNPSQKAAVQFALAAPEVACIHGPPGSSYRYSISDPFIDVQSGTGKTHTLIEIIRQLTSHPPYQKLTHVLVCGASNLSVDNILERLLALPPPEKGKGSPLKVTRIGHPARVMTREDVLDATLEVKAGRSDQVRRY